MERLRQGIHEYRTNVFPQQKELLEKLAKEGQKPHTLVIACSDSRIKTSEWTQADPGEFFVVRNAGNVVPPYSAGSSGVAASIEYAIKNLPIRNVIVAGHSHCGAVSALFTPELLEQLPLVKAWLDHALESRRRAEEKHPDSTPEQAIRWAIGENVLLQIEHLKEYPCVQEKLQAGELEIYAWVLEFETGQAWEYSDKTGQWAPIE